MALAAVKGEKTPAELAELAARAVRRRGIKAGRVQVATLMKKMAIAGDLPPAERVEAGAGGHDIPITATQAGGDPAEPGLGHRHHSA